MLVLAGCSYARAKEMTSPLLRPALQPQVATRTNSAAKAAESRSNSKIIDMCKRRVACPLCGRLSLGSISLHLRATQPVTSIDRTEICVVIRRVRAWYPQNTLCEAPSTTCAYRGG